MRHGWAARLALGALVVSTIIAGCREDPVEVVEVPHVFDLNVDAAAGIAYVDSNRAGVLPAEQLRGLLTKQLAWHGITLVETMRAARRGDPDLQVWVDALVENTRQVTDSVGLVYGPAGARAFNQQWAQHTQFLVDFAVAIGNGDGRAADEASASLADYTHDSATFFEVALDGQLPAAAVEALLVQHVDDMMRMIEADADGDRGATAELVAVDSTVLTDIATALSGAIVAQQPAAFPGSVDTSQANFCSIITSRAAGYVSTLLVTGDASSAPALGAADALSSATGVEPAVVIGNLPSVQGGDDATNVEQARTALDRAFDYGATAVPLSLDARGN